MTNIPAEARARLFAQSVTGIAGTPPTAELEDGLMARLDEWRFERAAKAPEVSEQKPGQDNDALADRDAERIARSLAMLDAYDTLTSQEDAAHTADLRRRKRRGWAMSLACSAVAAAVIAHHVALVPDQFRAEATLAIGPVQGLSANAVAAHVASLDGVRAWGQAGGLVTVWAEAPEAEAAAQRRGDAIKAADLLLQESVAGPLRAEIAALDAALADKAGVGEPSELQARKAAAEARLAIGGRTTLLGTGPTAPQTRQDNLIQKLLLAVLLTYLAMTALLPARGTV